jgi:hypothetical protein
MGIRLLFFLLNIEYIHGDEVMVKHDPDKHKWMVVMILWSPNGIMYQCDCGVDSKPYYTCELEPLEKTEMKRPHVGFKIVKEDA